MTQYNILIVDDEATIRMALQRWFTLRGFAVDVAVDGLDAVEKAQGKQYDIITMDLDMPRMGGVEAIAHIRTRQPGLPIIVLTGYLKDVDTALSSGASRVFVKPVQLRELEDRVRELLGSS